MYLNAKRYLWTHGDHPDKQIANTVQALFPELKDCDRWGHASSRVKEIIAEAIYWRKSNQIHDWFVKNVQAGEDNCGHYYVSREKLNELHQLILEVLDTKNAKLLPPAAGFFFGSTDIDEYYWDDLRRTASEIESTLAMFGDGWDFEYHSSW